VAGAHTAAAVRQASVRIASPPDGAYVSGPLRLAITAEPLERLSDVKNVRWFADGRQVCSVDRQPFSCDWDAGPSIREHQFRAVVLMRDGARLVDSVRTKAVEYAESVDVDVMQVTAVVTDGRGRFVADMRKQDFVVYDNDRRQAVTHFASQNIPLELVAAVDVSSSMSAALPHVKEAAKAFLAQLAPSDQVTLLGFNENIITLARRATDQAVRARAIDRLAPWGSTALYDVILRSLDLLGRQPGRRAMVVFTDGDDQASRAGMPAVLQRAEASDATMYMIGAGRALDAPSLQELMNRLATVSGGRAFFPGNEARLEAIFRDVLEDLRHQYLLTYPAPDNARDGRWHRIRVEVPSPYHVRARQGYRLAPAAAE
jgi:VWFA-related protein